MAAWWQKIIPSKNDRELKRINVLVDQIASLEAKFKALPDASSVSYTHLTLPTKA